MNNWSGAGRLTRDPEIRVTETQKTVARFTVAINRSKTEADFIRCVAFDKEAEFLEKYFHQGDRIGVTGSIRTGSYTNKDGQKVQTTEIYANKVEFLQDKREEVPGIDDNPFLT